MRASTSAAHLLLLCAAAVLSYDAIPYPECAAGEYFDISSLLCESCPAGQEPDAQRTSCQCSSGVLQGSACVPCAADAAPSRDGTACVACLPPANSSCAEEAAQGVCNGTADGCAFAGECACAAGLAVVEDDGVGGLLPFKRCRACAAGKYFSGVDAYTCAACPAANMVARADAQGCQCAAGYLSRQHLNGWWGRDISCVPLAEYTAAGFAEFDTTAATRVRFRDLLGGGTFEVSSSKIFQQLLLPAAVECYRAVSASPLLPRAQPLLAGNEACQAVGNLCVLQLYDETTEACQLYRALQDFSATVPSHQENEWRLRMPGLYYSEGPAAYTIENINYLEVALPPSAGSELQYMLAAYSLNGTYLGLSVLDAQLQLCSGISRHPSAFRSVGTSQRLACDLTLSQLLEYAEPVFFDLYLYHDPELSPSTVFPSTGGASDAGKSLYPVPVKLLNYQRNGVRPNADGDSTTARLNDQLTRRFFLVDSAAGATNGAAATLPSAVRWASLVELLFTLRTTVHPSRVLPPILTVEYSEAVLPATATAATLDQTYAQLGGAAPTAAFVATYTMQMDGTTSTLSILLVMLVVAWILGWFVSLLFVMRRNQRQVVDGVFMLKALALLCAVFASAFFWLVFGASAWLFLLFKAQDSIYLMMPSEDYWNFQLLLSLTFIAKCVHIVDLLHTQTQHDIFFIDFEQPAVPPGGAAHDGLEKASTVSAWRTVFVANEWVKLQGQRKISIELSLLLLLFVLRGLEWERYATRVPKGLGEAGVPEHFLLRFALSSALLIGIAMAQAFFRWVLWDRFIKDRIWQFVDLLSVTNVSCILLEERYFGYYLHGKTVHQHADADLLTLNKNLQDEEDGKLPKRGYTQNSDIQTFEIHITRGVREQYDEAFVGEAGRPLDIRQRGSLRQRRGFRSTPEELLRKRQKVNEFFTEFLIKPLQEKQAGASQVEQVVVRQKTYWEKLLHIPPETSFSTHRSFFLEDPDGRFRRIMLAGREYDLVMFNVLTYGLFDMVYTNTFVAIFFTYFLDLLVRVVRAELAVYNIARKTCIDQRFLL